MRIMDEDVCYGCGCVPWIWMCVIEVGVNMCCGYKHVL